MKKITALLLAVLMVFTLAACNKTKAPVSDSVVGTYYLTKADEGGEEISLEGIPTMSVVLNEDNTGTYGYEGNYMVITWSQEGNTITLISEDIGPDDPLVLTFDGTNLVGTTDGLTMTYTKQ